MISLAWVTMSATERLVTKPAREPARDPARDPELIEEIARFSILDGASPEQLRRFADGCEEVELEEGALLMEEGEEADSLYLLLEGQVEILKAHEDGTVHPVGEREAGRSLGDWSWVQGGKRTASVRAQRPCRLLRMPFSRLEDGLASDPEAGRLLLRNIAGVTVSSADELGAQKLATELKAAEERAFAARFMVSVLLTTVFYMFALGAVSDLIRHIPSTLVGLPILGIFALAVFLIIRRSERPLAFYGLTLVGWKKNLFEALVASVPVMLLVVAAKLAMVHLMPGAAGRPLFDLGAFEGTSFSEVALLSFLYTLFVPIQEMIARSGLQAPLESMMEGPSRALRANLVASLLFSMTHLHLSTGLALLVFPFGLYWGWLFRRQKSLLGPCLSHILIGNFAFVIVGFDGLF